MIGCGDGNAQAGTCRGGVRRHSHRALRSRRWRAGDGTKPTQRLDAVPGRWSLGGTNPRGCHKTLHSATKRYIFGGPAPNEPTEGMMPRRSAAVEGFSPVEGKGARAKRTHAGATKRSKTFDFATKRTILHHYGRADDGTNPPNVRSVGSAALRRGAGCLRDEAPARNEATGVLQNARFRHKTPHFRGAGAERTHAGPSDVGSVSGFTGANRNRARRPVPAPGGTVDRG